jgi:hypothetical protein
MDCLGGVLGTIYVLVALSVDRKDGRGKGTLEESSAFEMQDFWVADAAVQAMDLR